MLRLWLLFFVVTATCRAKSSVYNAYLQAEEIDKKLKLLDPIGLLKNRIDKDIDRRCAKDLAIYERAIDIRQLWALKMLDASSKIPTGLLEGHIVDIGMYDECIDAKSAEIEIQGRHCSYNIEPKLKNNSFPIKTKVAICLPASCSANDVIQLINGNIQTNSKMKDFGIQVKYADCVDVNPPTFDFWAIVFTTILFIYIIFIVVCTIYDYRTRNEKLKDASGQLENLVGFSVLKNYETIFYKKSNDNDFPAIHGIRVISTLWIVLVHEYFMTMFSVNVNMLYAWKWFESWRSVIPILGFFSVDTFFVLSGFLMSYKYFQEMQTSNRFNVITFYLHRFLRLTPPLFVFIYFINYITPQIISGLNLEFFKQFFMKCDQKWWAILLYIQNFVDRNNFCILHFWSLAVDMQLYWISPIILYPLSRRPKLGLSILTLLLITSIMSTAWIIKFYKYFAILMAHDFNLSTILSTLKYVYTMPYTRASPWLLGVLLGYEVTHKNIKVTTMIINCGWIAAIAGFSFCILGIRLFSDPNYNYNTFWEVTYGSLARPAWGFAICWIIYACIHNPKGLVTKILSSRIFVPLSKLSYSIYITHIVFPSLYNSLLKVPTYYSELMIVHNFISNVVLSIVTALIFHLFFEAPFLILDKMIFKRRSKAIKNNEKKSS